MPAIDECEPAVIRAFGKAGWRVTDQPYAIEYQNRRFLFADVRFTDANRQIIVTEVKCFSPQRQFWVEFYHAVGQYLVYRTALRLTYEDEILYLAIPLQIYAEFMQMPLVQATISDFAIKMVVIDTEDEEIALWTTSTP